MSLPGLGNRQRRILDFVLGDSGELHFSVIGGIEGPAEISTDVWVANHFGNRHLRSLRLRFVT